MFNTPAEGVSLRILETLIGIKNRNDVAVTYSKKTFMTVMLYGYMEFRLGTITKRDGRTDKSLSRISPLTHDKNP